jgi:hypothetical protein
MEDEGSRTAILDPRFPTFRNIERLNLERGCYSPAIVILSILIVGEAIRPRISKSLPTIVMF